MAIAFPSSPSPGDIFTSNGKSWQYVNGKWEAYGEIIAPDVFSVDAVNDVVNVYGSLAAGASASIAGDLAVDTNTLFVDSTNDFVGVGTETPANKLDVSGGLTVQGIALTQGLIVTNGLGGSPVEIQGGMTVDSTTLHVDATNNRVGVGTTSPAEELHVVKDQNASHTELLVENLDQRVRLRSYYEAGVIQYSSIQSEMDGGADITLALNPEGGNVGIGTVVPVAKLHAEGNIQFGTGGTYGAGQLYSDANWGVILRAKQSSPTTADFSFRNAADTERLRIDNAGRVTIPYQTSWRVGLLTQVNYAAGTHIIPWDQTSGSDMHLVSCTLSGGAITVPIGGVYFVSVHIRTEAATGGNTAQVYLRKNGAIVTRWYQTTNTVSNFHHYGPLVTSVKAGPNDYFDVVFIPVQNVSLSSSGNTVVHFSGHLLG